jgi:glucokinase
MMPLGGLYLAGGIASKFEKYFLESGHFMKGFTNKPKHAK